MAATLFTIVIPTHNRAARLPEAINSVIAQHERDWELIVVDDGSTDDTRQVVARFTDPRIRYHYQENQQLNGARNTGVSLARGQYLGFLDDDDYFLPQHLALLRKNMEADDFQHDIYRCGELLKRDGKLSETPNYQNGKDILQQYWQDVTGMFGMVFRLDIMRKTPFDKDLLLLDDFVWLNAVLRTASLHQIDAYTAVVNIHPQQRSSTYPNEELLRENVDRLAAAYNLAGVSERVPFRYYHKQVLHQYMHCCRALCRDKKNYRAIKVWKEGISYASAQDWRDVTRTFAMISTGR